MKQFTYIITDEIGIHARPATLLVNKTSKFKSEIKLQKKDKTVDAKGLISVMTLGARKNDKVIFLIEGEDEEKAAIELEDYCKKYL